MLSNEKTVKWLLKHRVDEFGNVNLNGLDFTSANCSVFFREIKVAKDLYQDMQIVGKNLFQDYQKVLGDLSQKNQKVNGFLKQSYQMVGKSLDQSHQNVDGNLYQESQIVKGNLSQCLQNVKGELVSHLLDKGEYWQEIEDNLGMSSWVIRKKKLKPITKEELRKMGYILKEN